MREVEALFEEIEGRHALLTSKSGYAGAAIAYKLATEDVPTLLKEIQVRERALRAVLFHCDTADAALRPSFPPGAQHVTANVNTAELRMLIEQEMK